jgi:hypothetical protein
MDFIMPADQQFRVASRWALASDGIQWMLQRQKGDQWRPVSFVRSAKEILARCMREKGTPADEARQLLDGLPDTFDEWLLNRYQDAASDHGHRATADNQA